MYQQELARLRQQGVRLNQRQYEADVSHLTAQDGFHKDTAYGVESQWTLPHPAPLQARFGPEKSIHKLVKVFRRELQTGDENFDNIVYIETKSKQATAAFLDNVDIRWTIFEFIQNGGDIHIDDTHITFDKITANPADEYADIEAMIRFIQALLLL